MEEEAGGGSGKGCDVSLDIDGEVMCRGNHMRLDAFFRLGISWEVEVEKEAGGGGGGSGRGCDVSLDIDVEVKKVEEVDG